jgi:hypothetical protein
LLQKLLSKQILVIIHHAIGQEACDIEKIRYGPTKNGVAKSD